MKILIAISKKRICPSTLRPGVLLVCLLLCAGTAAYAQSAKLDLSRLDKLASKAAQVKDVNLDGPMLKQIGRSHFNLAGAPAEFMDMAGRLQGIYVRKYEFDKPGEYSKADVKGLLKQFRSGGWHPMVTDENKRTGEIKNIYQMSEGGETVGLAIVKLAPKEIDVVNIVGPINMGKLGSMFLGSSNMGRVKIGRESHGDSAPKLQHRNPSDQKANPPEEPK